MAWVTLCSLDELVDGKGKYVEVDGFHLAVFLSDSQISVLDSACPHAGANLADGFIEDGCAVCPWHYWAFDLNNGQLRESPGVSVKKYATRIHEHQFLQADLPLF